MKLNLQELQARQELLNKQQTAQKNQASVSNTNIYTDISTPVNNIPINNSNNITVANNHNKTTDFVNAQNKIASEELNKVLRLNKEKDNVIYALQSTISDLQKEILILKNTVSDFRIKISDLESFKQSYNQDLECANFIKEENSKMTIKISDLESLIEKIKLEKDGFEKINNQNTAKLKDYEKVTTDLLAEKDVLLNKIKELENENNTNADIQEQIVLKENTIKENKELLEYLAAKFKFKIEEEIEFKKNFGAIQNYLNQEKTPVPDQSFIKQKKIEKQSSFKSNESEEIIIIADVDYEF